MQSSYTFGSADAAEIRKECSELIKQLQLEFFKRAQEGAKDELRAAEQEGDDEKFSSAMGKFQEFSKKINELKK